MIDCQMGQWSIGGRTIRDDHPKGVISVADVIKFSSNIGAAKMGFMLGPERLIGYLKNFGIARPEGLGLPGEVPGLIRNPATIRPLELATTAFGQGVTASPVQLAAAMSTIANGGLRMIPYLTDAILDREGEVETRFEPRVDRQVITSETATTTALMMEGVTEDGGTGTRARVEGYRVAGKTGTAQKVENGVYSATKRVSSFVGFLPADHPVVTISVMVDSATVGSKYGGMVAAPVFSEIGEFVMRYMGIPTEPPLVTETVASEDGEPPPPPKPAPKPVVPSPPPPPVELQPDGDGGWILPDLTGRSMRAAVSALQPAGVALQVNGEGRVAGQAPAPGSRISPGDSVYLRFN
jgi:cell division protein FtsI (penicillin-binding protein 3)